MDEQDMEEKIEATMLPILQKNQRVTKIKKAILIIGIILTPLIVLQWELKFYTLMIYLPYVSCLAFLYIPAFYLIIKRVYLGYWLSWGIYILLSFLFLANCNFYVEWLFSSYSLDFWLNVFMTIFAFLDKDIDYKKIIKKQKEV